MLTELETRVLQEFLPAEGVALDIGAHSGEWSQAALRIRPGIRVHAFEPSPQPYEKMVGSLAEAIASGLVVPQQRAASDRQQERTFHHYAQSAEWSTFYRRPGVELHNHLPPPECLTVQCVTVDSYCAAAGIGQIAFLKIDTEGAELDVLRGAADLLRNQRVDLVQFEYGGTYRDAGITLEQVFSFLNPLGYEIFRMGKTGLDHKPRFTPSEEDYQYSNFLAVARRFLQEREAKLAASRGLAA